MRLVGGAARRCLSAAGGVSWGRCLPRGRVMNRFGVAALLVGALLVPGGRCCAQERTLRTTLKGHLGPVFCVAFGPDGKMLASGSNDSTIMLWDVATGIARATLEGHRGRVS